MNKKRFLLRLSLAIMMGSLLLSVILSVFTEVHPVYIDTLKIAALCVAFFMLILSFMVNNS
jgi:hypothetical protein